MIKRFNDGRDWFFDNKHGGKVFHEGRHYYASTPIVDKGHLKQFELLRKAILENKPCLCNEIAGANATYICNKCIESINSGKAVSLDMDYLE